MSSKETRRLTAWTACWRAPDNTVQFGSRTLQLLPGPHRSSYARARVEVREGLDGSASGL